MRKKLFFLVLFFTINILTATMTVAQEENQYTANFIYNVPQHNRVSSVNVIFTVLKPTYTTSNNLMWFSSKQFANLHDAVQRDLQKILEVKGFAVRGPFENYNLIPYPEKMKIDFILIANIELIVSLKDETAQPESIWIGKSPIMQTGNAEITGKVIIEAKEIATRELMWVKKIDVKKFQFPYVVRAPYNTPYPTPGKLYSYEPIFTVMAKGFEEQYPEIMNLIYNSLNPGEIIIIKKEAQTLKSKKK